MKMIRYITPLLLVATIGLGSGSSYAQQTDTLRRSLKVMTSEEIKLSERSPQPFTLTAPPVYTVQPTSVAPPVLPGQSDLLRLYPVSATPALPPFSVRQSQLGYVDAAVGVQYNGYFALGIRPVQTSTNQLDLSLSGQMTRYTTDRHGIESTAREHLLSVSAGYQHRLEQSRWGINADYRYASSRYYGIYPLNVTQTSSPLVHAPATLLLHDLALSGAWHTARVESLWQVAILPTLDIFSAYSGGLADGLGVRQTREIAPRIAVVLSRELSQGWGALGLDAALSMYRRQSSSDASTAYLIGGTSLDGQSRSLIHLNPYWRNDGGGDAWTWGYRLGAQLIAYSQGGDTSGVRLAPDLHGHLSWMERWRADLTVSGNILPGDLRTHYREMPYLLADVPTRLTHRPISAALQLSGRILPQLTVELRAEYERLNDAVNYRPLALRPATMVAPTTLPFLGLSFVPVYGDGELMTLGGAVSYRHRGIWGIRTSLKQTSLSESLWGRPTTQLELAWQLNPSENWNVAVGYNLLSGIRFPGLSTSMDYATSPMSQMTELKALQVLHFTATYRIGQRWSLHADGQYSLNGDSERYIGYTPQRIACQVGASYTF